MHLNATADEGRLFKRLSALILALFLSGFLFAAAAPSASALPEKFFGLQFGPPYLKSESDLEAVGRSGAKYWRIGIDCFDWYGHESTVWKEEMDTRFRLAWEHGVQVLPVLGGRCKSVSDELPSREEWGLWESFLQQAVEHYGYLGSFWQGKENKKEVENWEIQNEPNLPDSGINGIASGVIYAEFFQRMSEKLHATQGPFFPSRALVGGLYYLHSNGAGKTPHTFMQEMSENVPSVKPWIDSVAIHPYESGAGSIPQIEADISEARNDINSMLGANKGLWITEVGWPVEHGDSGHATVTPSQQAQLLTELFNWVKSVQASKDIRSLIYYNYRDFENGENPWWTRCGLRSGVPSDRYSRETFRPSWYTFQEEAGASRWPVSPNAETQPATSVTSTSATLNGTIDPHGLPTGYHFDWAEGSEGFSHQIPAAAQDIGWREGRVSESQTLTGLKPDTTYVFRLVATNENHETYVGANVAFTTLPGSPTVVVDGSGVQHIYYSNSVGQFAEWYRSGSSWQHRVWGSANTMAGDPSAVATSDGSRWVYFRATNGTMHSWWFNGSNWSENSWGYANTLGDNPTAIVGPSGAREVFYFGSDGILYRWWFLGSEWNLEPIGPR